MTNEYILDSVRITAEDAYLVSKIYTQEQKCKVFNSFFVIGFLLIMEVAICLPAMTWVEQNAEFVTPVAPSWWSSRRIC